MITKDKIASNDNTNNAKSELENALSKLKQEIKNTRPTIRANHILGLILLAASIMFLQKTPNHHSAIRGIKTIKIEAEISIIK